MIKYDDVRENLKAAPVKWLVTGVAGFIGSNLLEELLLLDQTVVGLDNFATGHRRNLVEVERRVGADRWQRFKFIEGDVRDLAACVDACKDVDYVLHQAALGSVPRSVEDPISTNSTNITGFLNMLVAARDAKVRKFVYAASSSTYGDHPGLPKIESEIGNPLSPYAVTKYVNELYASVFDRAYGTRSIGLRYFNVFGPRQDPEGAYAAVIPKWVSSLIGGESVFINGDGETSRDFCYVSNVVQANILAATATDESSASQVYNVAVGERTSLNELYRRLQTNLTALLPTLEHRSPIHRDFRTGDVRHSLASIEKATCLLGYSPTHTLDQGLAVAMPWYVESLGLPESGFSKKVA